MAEEATQDPSTTSYDLILYTDGGCKPSRGKGGYGFHGYHYTPEKPKQGAGAKATPTSKGYSDDKLAAVTVAKYVDCWSSWEGITTNNAMELMAAIEALNYADECNAKSLLLYVDSTYVRDGLNDWVGGWVANGWKKSNGDDVNNRDLWEKLLDAKATLEQKWVTVTIDWVKGHNGDLGNSVADMLASRGVILSQKGVLDRQLYESEAKGYWSLKSEYNRMLSKSCWYFNTNASNSFKADDGRYIYHLGKHGSNDSMLGKRMSDASFAVVYLKESEEVLETIRAEQDLLTDGYVNQVVIGRLDAIRQPKHTLDLLKNGGKFLHAPTRNIDLFTPEKVQLTKECRPARLAYTAIESLINLESLLEEYLNTQNQGADVTSGPRSIQTTDITDQLFDVETTTKGKKKTTLKKSISISTRSINAKVAYDLGEKSGEETITLVLDMDLIDRNALSALANKEPIVKVITWKESDRSFRYATIVECGDDVGIWSSIYSNLRILP